MDSYDNKMNPQGYPPAYSAVPQEAPPPPPPPQMVVVTSPPAVGVVPVVVGQQMGSQPSGLVCRSCGAQIITRVERKPTVKTHLFALVLCLVGFWPCVWVPYCVDSCNSADHYCPNCDAYIGSYIN